MEDDKLVPFSGQRCSHRVSIEGEIWEQREKNRGTNKTNPISERSVVFRRRGFRVASGNDDFQNALHALLKKFGRLHGSFRTFKRLLIECCLTYSIANFVHLYFVYGTIAVFSLRAAYDRRNFQENSFLDFLLYCWCLDEIKILDNQDNTRYKFYTLTYFLLFFFFSCYSTFKFTCDARNYRCREI